MAQLAGAILLTVAFTFLLDSWWVMVAGGALLIVIPELIALTVERKGGVNDVAAINARP
jgi:hypothetical protein